MTARFAARADAGGGKVFAMRGKALRAALLAACLAVALSACAPQQPAAGQTESSAQGNLLDLASDKSAESASVSASPAYPSSAQDAALTAEQARAALSLSEDYRPAFDHGAKPAQFQKYIVLHDTESDADAASTIAYWDGAGAGVAAHFIVNRDGTVVQCVPMDAIAHHAGFGDTGHNEYYGVEDESRDDKVGTVPIGDWAADYGMNSYSIGIEMVHVGGSGYYPEEQLVAVDALIAYIDAYYGFPSQIIDHKAWRSGNSDTSPEFGDYLANYQDHRTHGEP